MRRPLALVFCVVLAAPMVTARAQARPAAATSDPASTAQTISHLRAKRRSAQIERNVGWFLAAAGHATVTVGVVLFATSGATRFDQGAANALAGLVTMAVGLVPLIPGLVLALDGQNRIADADWRLQAMTAAFLVPRPGGFLVGANLRF